MQKIVIIILVLISNNIIYCINIENDNIDILLNNIINTISNDSMFIESYGIIRTKSISFYIRDSTCVPPVTFSTIKALYPDFEDKNIISRGKYVKSYYSRRKVLHNYIPQKYKNNNSDYKICFDFMDEEIIGVLVYPKLEDNDSKMLQYFMIFDDKMQVVRYLGSEYKVSK